MSWILIVTIGVFALCGYIGWKKGIISIVVSIAALLVSIIATAFLSPLVAQTIKKNTDIYTNLCDSMYRVVSTNEKVSETVNGTIAQEEDVTIAEDNLKEYESIIDECLDKINGVMNLPDEFGEKVSETFSDSYLAGIVQGENTVKDIVVKAFAFRLADVIFQAIVYIIIFVVVWILLRIVVIASGLIARLPVIHGANKMLGMAAGLVEGLLIVWVLFMLLTAMSGNEHVAVALTDINNNALLKMLYENNVIMKMIFR